ncbi:MAG TPA: hypothetical protein V6C97_00545 [Oculatellaceae cyanobacterium]
MDIHRHTHRLPSHPLSDSPTLSLSFCVYVCVCVCVCVWCVSVCVCAIGRLVPVN